VHALEHLGMTDMGIVMLRKMLRDQLARLEKDEDPINIMQGAATNQVIETHAWNTILSREETAQHRDENV
jgi:hypothetical protein